jgi:catechol 2,3-dioxygenase-like lactoylglutathione lyase family enzyme
MTIEINGMAHVILTVSRFEVAREFYRRLLPELGMKVVFDGERFFYCVGAQTAIATLTGRELLAPFDGVPVNVPALSFDDTGSRSPAMMRARPFISGMA